MINTEGLRRVLNGVCPGRWTVSDGKCMMRSKNYLIKVKRVPPQVGSFWEAMVFHDNRLTQRSTCAYPTVALFALVRDLDISHTTDSVSGMVDDLLLGIHLYTKNKSNKSHYPDSFWVLVEALELAVENLLLTNTLPNKEQYGQFYAAVSHLPDPPDWENCVWLIEYLSDSGFDLELGALSPYSLITKIQEDYK